MLAPGAASRCLFLFQYTPYYRCCPRVPDELAERSLREERRPAPSSGRLAFGWSPAPAGTGTETCIDLQLLYEVMVLAASCGSLPESVDRVGDTFGRTRPSSAVPGSVSAVPFFAPFSRGSPSKSLGLARGTQLVRASEAVTLRSEESGARALRRADARPVISDEESFTAAWRPSFAPWRSPRSLPSPLSLSSSSLSTQSLALTCTLSTSPAGTCTPRASRKHSSYSRTRPLPIRRHREIPVHLYAPGRS